MAYEIKIEDGCIGCGNCEAICPKSFKMVNGQSVVQKSSIEEITCEKEAAESCPVGIIKVIKK